jgi:hypothetical protein
MLFDYVTKSIAHRVRFYKVAGGEMRHRQAGNTFTGRCPMRTSSLPSPHHPRLFAAAGTWLLAGSGLLLSTLVPAHTSLLGWTPAFWLLVAPLLVLLALAPGLPRRWLKRRRLHVVHTVHGAGWR